MLVENDLLLIEDELRINQDCTYTLSNFKNDYAFNLRFLKTKKSIWKLKFRNLLFEIFKIIDITVSKTQKLMLQTILKQHILDKWNSLFSRANSEILNQYYDVEINHCIDNARRVALRQIMTFNSVMSVLKRQKSNWMNESWNKTFDEVLRNDDKNMIFSVWMTWIFDKTQMTKLFCCVFEFLNSTDRNQHSFQNAFFYDNEEKAVSIKFIINDWSIVLKKTLLIDAYVIINNSCFNCEVFDHIAFTYYVQNARTILQTKFVAGKSNERYESARHYKLQFDNDLLKKIDCESADTTIVEFQHFEFRSWTWNKKS